MWSAGLNIVRDILQFGQMLILVRLLDPAIYGMAGMATTIVNFLGLISFQHIIPHVLQIRDPEKVNFHEQFTAGVVINGALFLLANLIAVGLTLLPDFAPLQSLIHVLSLTYLLSVPVDTRVKMLEREHNWARLRTLQLVSIVISIVCAILMALMGAGVYALIIPGLLGSMVFIVDLFFQQKWFPQWQFDFKSYRETFGFAMFRAGSNALNGGRGLVQNSLVTQFFQFSTLGVYGRAEGLANLFCGRVAQEASSSLHPVITRANPESEQFQRMAGLVLQAVCWVVIPIGVLFAWDAEKVIAVVYGEKWSAVVPILPWVMMTGVMVSIGATTYGLLVANNKYRLCLRSDLVAFIIAVTSMVMLIPRGLEVYVRGALIVAILIAFILISLLIYSRGVKLQQIIVAVLPASTAAVAGMVVLEFIPGNFGWITTIRFVELMMDGVVFAAAYVLVLRFGFRHWMATLVSYIPMGPWITRSLRL